MDREIVVALAGKEPRVRNANIPDSCALCKAMVPQSTINEWRDRAGFAEQRRLERISTGKSEYDRTPLEAQIDVNRDIVERLREADTRLEKSIADIQSLLNQVEGWKAVAWKVGAREKQALQAAHALRSALIGVINGDCSINDAQKLLARLAWLD